MAAKKKPAGKAAKKPATPASGRTTRKLAKASAAAPRKPRKPKPQPQHVVLDPVPAVPACGPGCDADTTEGVHGTDTLRYSAPRRRRVSRWVLVALALAVVVGLSVLLYGCRAYHGSLQPPRAYMPPVSCGSLCAA